MNGTQEYNKKYMDKLNNILEGKPDYLQGFVNSMNKSLISTKYNYLLHVCNFVEYINKPISDVKYDDFINYIANMQYKADGSETTSSYRITAYSALKKFSQYLYASDRIPKNYMIESERPKAEDSQKTIQKREIGYLTEGEIKKYIKNVKLNNLSSKRYLDDKWNLRDLTIIQLFLNTGIRCNALCKLDVNSINKDENSIIITDKGNKTRTITLSNEMMDLLDKWTDTRREILNGEIQDALFISNRKRRMDQASVSRVVNKYAKVITGKNITPHKLRATYGTEIYNKTGDLYYTQACMNHSNPKTTEVYIRGQKNVTKSASEIMGKITL